MGIEIFVNTSGVNPFDELNRKLEAIMASQAEQAAALRALSAQLTKARAEIIRAVDRLALALANAGATTPEVDAATADLQAVVQTLDDLNPDEAPTDAPA